MRAVLPLIALFLPLAAHADDVQIAKGRMHSVGSYAIQTVAATNNTNTVINFLGVECGFFRNNALIVAGEGVAQNVLPKQTAYFDVRADQGEGADRTECRVQYPLTTRRSAFDVQPVAAAPAPAPHLDEIIALRAVAMALITVNATQLSRASGKPPQVFSDIIAKASADAINGATITGVEDANQTRQAASDRLKELFAGLHF
jgi:hypothetical protein